MALENFKQIFSKTFSPPEENSLKYKPIKVFYLVFLILFFALLAFLLFSIPKIPKNSCGDGTSYNSCSTNQPYFCDRGTLIEKASLCGCPKIMNRTRDNCTSVFQTNPRKIRLNYILRGKKYGINFTIYGGLSDYLLNKSKEIYYSQKSVNREELEKEKVNNLQQKELLIPLLVKIQNLGLTKIDQMRVAISLVQNVPYSLTQKTVKIRGYKIPISIYPYEALYNNHAFCEDKSWLLEFLLRGIGYKTASFYYPLQNHEAVGISCPLKYSLNKTGYCFLETTGISILSDSNNYYAGGVFLNTTPILIKMSNGTSLGDKLYEYADAKSLSEIDSDRVNSTLTFYEYFKLKNLRKKYGLLY